VHFRGCGKQYVWYVILISLSNPVQSTDKFSQLDLLNDRNPISILEDPFGAMQLVGILEKNPTTPEEWLSLIDIAKELRSTETTAKNDQSSRSHAICRIRIVNTEIPNSPEGTFLLVDLAGSEASADTQNHTRERIAETREINKSLTTLKDCIRSRAIWSIGRGEATQKHIHIPFRSSKLTQVLKSAFDVNNTQTCKTLVISCINPSILDVAHSKNTLRYAEMLKVPVPKAKPRPYDERIPTTWENKHIQDWISKNVCTAYLVTFIMALTTFAVKETSCQLSIVGTQRKWSSVLSSARRRICWSRVAHSGSEA
jgi:kinesin family member 2/24